MSDLQPTAGPTAGASVVSGTPATSDSSVVSSAQAQANTPPTSNDNSVLLSRINALMSEKDKAINDRNNAINSQASLQQQLTQLQEQTQSSLTAAATAAQQAIDNATRLERELQQEKAKNVKLAALLKRPHLAAYENLIPANSDEAQVQAVIEQLEQIRQQDIERARAQVIPQQQVQQQSQAQQQDPQQALIQSLYGNRANMNPVFQMPTTPVSIPGSTPAQMNPGMGTGNSASAIQQLFDDAKRAGTDQAFQEALQRATLMAEAELRQGR